MKKKLFTVLLTVFLAAMFVLPVSAWDNFTMPKTNTAPVIDGKLDDCYVKLHDFYQTAEFLDNMDTAHAGAGCTYVTYDDASLYVYIEAVHDNYSPVNDPKVSSNGSCMYLAILSGLPDAFNADSQIQLAINLSADGKQEWKYTGSVPENARDNSVDMAIYKECPFKFMVVRDNAKKTTYYEIGLPWTQLDRTGTIDFKEGHVFTFDYIVTLDPGVIVQYGQGLMNDIYDGGAYITLGAAPVAETEAPVTAAAAGTDAADGAAAAQTSDLTAVFVLASIIALAGITAARKK
jgi:hypothetical protein